MLMPVLDKIIVSDYRNIVLQEIAFSRKINCITGNNGEGKTNLLDAIYYLSMGKSAFQQSDRYLFRHGTARFGISGTYRMESGKQVRYSISVEPGSKKMKADEKAYQRLSDHIGVLPVVMVSPYDTALVDDPGEERRRFLNMLISQVDRRYLHSLQSYNRILAQRNSLLRSGVPDLSLLDVLDTRLADAADYIYNKRCEFIAGLSASVKTLYAAVSASSQEASIGYKTELKASPAGLYGILAASREKDAVLGYTSHGVHRDDLDFVLDGVQLRRAGSQGERKSFIVALKFAQYSIMKDIYGFSPIMLLDDLFDKLDPSRVSNLLKMVLDKDFGQIFLTDCNKVRMRTVVDALTEDKAYFEVRGGVFCNEEEGA